MAHSAIKTTLPYSNRHETYLIIETDLRRTVGIAEALERRGGAIVGVVCDGASALAIAEGENVDFAVLGADFLPTDVRWQTAAALFVQLSIQTLTILHDGNACLLRNPSPFRVLTTITKGERRWHLGRTGRGF